jgi:hypothetical protein
MEIINKTFINNDIINDYLNFTLGRLKFPMIIFGFLSVALIDYALLIQSIFEPLYIIIGSIIFIATNLFLALFLPKLSMSDTKRRYKNTPVVEYTFYEKYFEIKSINDDEDIITKYEYNRIEKIVETKNILIIYEDMYQPFLLDKTKFLYGNINQLTNLIKGLNINFKSYVK